MRNAFAEEIEALAADNEKVVLLSGDIGNRLFNPYKARFADRFYNCGIAEANMTTLAAGMAMNGFRPVTYTITPFNTSRCYEQIKVDVCYHNLPVVIVGVGAGLSYAGLGATHHSFEDIAIMRTLPNMHILCPGDAVEVRLCLKAALALEKPVYIRIGKKNEPVIHEQAPDLRIGEGITVREGGDVCILSCGNLLPMAVEAAEKLESRGVHAKVVSMHTVKPIHEGWFEQLMAPYETICTVEEHGLTGGFGAAVLEWLADRGMVRKTVRFGIPDEFLEQCGSQEHAREMAGLTSDNIVQTVIGT